MINFQSLLSQATQALGLIGQAQQLWQHLQQNLADAKDTLSEAEYSQIKAKLDEIHAANMKLSQELDANLAILEQRGAG